MPQIYDAMEQNGSPTPRFDFDAGRTYFRVTLPAHPEYAAVSAIQDAAYLSAVGSAREAFNRVQRAWEANEASAILAIEMIRLHAAQGQLEDAEAVFARFQERGPQIARAYVANTLIEALLAGGRGDDARRLLGSLSEVVSARDAIDTAILACRLGDQQAAHRYFKQAGHVVLNDSRALLEFAQTKIGLAQQVMRKKKPSWREVNRRLLVEARELLGRVIQMDASPARHAWAWRELARTLDWLRAPRSEVESAFQKARELLPDEPRFAEDLARFRRRHRRTPRRSGRSGSGPGR